MARDSEVTEAASPRTVPSYDEQPIADVLVKPFQRERFALAVERGRQWRRQALDELRWHAVLSSELRDRVGQIVAMMAARESADPSDADVLADLARERAPETLAHGERVARRSRAIARELHVDDDSVDAVAEILRCSPVQFDPEVVGAFLDILSRE